MSKVLAQEELQRIENMNKILLDHQELVKLVITQTQEMLNDYLPVLQSYMQGIIIVRDKMGQEVNLIIQSTRQISIVTRNTQQIIDFTQAVIKLESILTPSLIEKLGRLVAK